VIEHTYQSLLPSIEHFHLLGYWVAFFAALLETTLVVGLLIPGSTLLLLLGALSAGPGLDLNGVLWFGIAGAVLGDNLNYWLGKRYGNRWARGGIWPLRPEHFEQARRFFDAHGAKSVFLGRFIPSVKEVTPFVAGTVGMRQRAFLLWNLLGGIGWGLQWIGAGYLFGQSLKLAEAWMSRAGIGVLLLVLLWIVLWLLKRALLRHGPRTWLLIRSLTRSIAWAIHDNPFVRRFVQRHPQLVRQLAARTDRTRFQGLPLTLLVLAFVYVLALTGGIVEDVVTSDPIVALDHATAQLVATFRAPEWVTPLIWITALGSSKVIVVLLALGALTLWLLRGPWLVAGLLVSSLGAAAFNALAKLTFQRPRPLEAILLEHSYSFPSGHATIAVAFYGFLGYVLIRQTRSWKRQVNWLSLSAVLILLIGLSRILLGVHYLSDVWAGYLVGGLWLIIGISLTEWLTATGHMQWTGPIGSTRRWLAGVLGAVGLAWYATFTIHWHPPRHPAPPMQTAQLDRPVTQPLLAQKIAYTETLLGQREQPLSLVILAQDPDSLLSRLHRAGWHQADKANPRNLLRLAVYGRDYTAAPMAPAFWNKRINDLSLQKVSRIGDRKLNDTLRIWNTAYRVGQAQVFVGIARAYEGMQWPLIHRISPDLDRAADAAVQSLKETTGPMLSCKTPLVHPMVGQFPLGEPFFSRGDLWLVNLTGRPEPAFQCEG
jgi:membrane protein DedA with SNARE-associated domain